MPLLCLGGGVDAHELIGSISDKNRKVQQRFIDCLFILGSTVEMERVWPLAKYPLTDYRKHMEPVIFEALLLLKGNKI